MPPNPVEPTAGEVLGALSHALDLVEGQARGHAERTWLIARRIAESLGLSERQRESLFFACVLKDSGCSTNSARLQQVFGGDETVAKRRVKFVDWSNPAASALYAMRSVAPGGTWTEKFRRLLDMAGAPAGLMDEVTAERCSRGADIARSLGFGDECAEAIHCLDEHWDGHGSADHLRGDAIPLLARILCLAQTLEVFAATHGSDAGYRIVRKRSRRWFDPEIVSAALSFENDRAFWTLHTRHLAGESVAIDPPPAALTRRAADTDRICEAFGTVVDAKSTFTGEHSSRVAAYAVGIGRLVGLPSPELSTLRRAGVLHDIGKLSVPNSILDKPDRLDEKEFARVKEHPRHSWEVLRRVPAFARIAELASAHHERLDGRGYWQGRDATVLCLSTRCLTAADVFDALTADRPYRKAMSTEEALAIMWRDEGKAFDPRCLEALAALHVGDSDLGEAA
ncbi:MAG: HD-GYP domain-containing protein [Fimbriimonas sp.]